MTEMDKLADEITFSQIKELKLENICYQLATRGKWPFESPFNSTSFFIEKNLLLTSAHNVVKTFRKVNQLNIAPSRIGKTYHFGQFHLNVDYSKNFRIYPDYEMRNKATRKRYDIAVIYIPNNVLEKNTSFNYESTLPILDDISSLEKGEQIYCAGYPASNQHKNRYRMTLDKSRIIDIEDHYFTHALETATGNSGSPIMVKRNNKFYVIGVNSIKHNGTLINAAKLNWIKESKNILDQ